MTSSTDLYALYGAAIDCEGDEVYASQTCGLLITVGFLEK